MALVNLQQISQQWKDSGKPQLTQSKSFVKCDCRDEAAYLSKGILKYFRTEANKKKKNACAFVFTYDELMYGYVVYIPMAREKR